MKAFRFPLEKALGWRRTQLEVEENRFKQQGAALAAVDQARAQLDDSSRRAEAYVRRQGGLDGSDLAALVGFLRKVRATEKELAARRLESEQRLAELQREMLEARRRCRLLERLKERRLEEWRTEADRETEAMASESFLAQWTGRG